jgi:hypothetical protein
MSEDMATDTEDAVDSDIESVDSPDVSAADQSAPAGAADAQQAGGQQENYYAAFRKIPQFAGMDDQQIAVQLYETLQREQAATQALRQYQQLVPVASEYLSNKDSYTKWKEAQQASAQQPQPTQQPQQPQQASWWNPPKIKDGYKQFLTRDAEGREVIAEHAPLEARAQLTEWMNYRADFARKFLDDPQQTIGPMVEQIASQRAAELVEQQITQQRREQFVSQIEAENRGWLYADPEKKIASREGVIVQKYIEDAKAMGIGDPQARWENAVAMLERDLALQVLQQYVDQQQEQPAAPSPAAPQPQQPAPNPAAEQAQRNMEFIRAQATRTAPRNSPATTNPRVPQRPLTFAERLKSDLQSQGITGLE